MTYLPVGWGSHHWEVAEGGGGRLQWDIKHMACNAARFLRPHADTADDVKSWELLSLLIRRASRLMRRLYRGTY
jgi:hypothetical protein